MRLPTIGHDVAELMAELIGELRPGLFAYVDDNPRHAAAVGMQPNGRWSGCVLVDTEPRRLAVGDKTNSVKA